MLKKTAIVLGLAALMLASAGALMYLTGVRVVLDGGGGVHLGFVTSADDQAEEIARHRQAQRAQQPAAAPATPSAPGAPSSQAAASASPASAPSAPSVPSVTSSVSSVSSGSSVYWTDFRGPQRNGIYAERALNLEWPRAGLKPLWRQPIGGGYASFVAANGRAFTIEQRADEEVAAAYDIVSGRELWTTTWNAAFREMMGGDGPRATPTWHDGTVYVLGATGELRALDERAGKTIWRTNILEDAGAKNLQWGMSAAPLIVGDTVIVLPGGGNGQSVVAYDRRTGKRRWSALDDPASYASPMLVDLGGVTQILVFTARRLAGITPDGGQLLWEFPWKTQYDVNASQPLVVGTNRVFLSTGYGTGAAMIELARKPDGAFAVTEVWRTNRMKNQFTSSVLHDGFIYGLDESILACLDAATGDLKWKGGRYGYGQIMLAGGHLIVIAEGGDLALVRATSEGHREVAKIKLFDERSWNHPAISDGYLLVRNATEMAAFDLRK